MQPEIQMRAIRRERREMLIKRRSELFPSELPLGRYADAQVTPKPVGVEIGPKHQKLRKLWQIEMGEALAELEPEQRTLQDVTSELQETAQRLAWADHTNDEARWAELAEQAIALGCELVANHIEYNDLCVLWGQDEMLSQIDPHQVVERLWACA